MKSFLFATALVALVNARLEAGYSYPRPQNLGISSGHNLGSFSSGSQNIGGFISGGDGGISSGGQNVGGLISQSGFISGGDGGFSSGGGGFSSGNSGSSGYITGNSHSHSGSIGGFSSGNSGFSSGSSGFVSGNSHSHSGIVNTGTSTIQKHIYVHVAPPEPEEFRQQVVHQHQAQKHYKIIFIKAPSPPTYPAPSVSLSAQNQEKTLVYVLVKKPDEQQDINIQTAAPVQPSKPEVYFIRYKTQKQVTGGNTGSSISLGSNSFENSGSSSIGSIGSVGSVGSIGTSSFVNSGSTGSIGSVGSIGSSTFEQSSVISGGSTGSSYGPPGHTAGAILH